MVDPSVLSVVLVVAVGVHAVARRLGAADWARPLPWVDLGLGVLFGIFAGSVADGAGVWVGVAAFVVGFCGFGFLAGVAALTVLRLPDPDLMAWVVVPLLVGFGFGYYLRAVRGKAIPLRAAVSDSAVADKRWRYAALAAPYLSMVVVLLVPMTVSGHVLARVLGVAVLTIYLIAIDHTRQWLMRPRRWTTRSAELGLALALVAAAASPVGEQVVRWWAATPELTGGGWYWGALITFGVFVVCAGVVGSRVATGPVLALFIVVGLVTRLVMLLALVLTACVALFHPHPDLLFLAAVGGLPAALSSAMAARRGQVSRQFGDVGLLAELNDTVRTRVIDAWAVEVAATRLPLMLPDAAGALAHQALIEPQPAPPWRVTPDQALAVAADLLDGIDRQLAREPFPLLNRARIAAGGDHALWQAKVNGERGQTAVALEAAKTAVSTFARAEAPFATALAWSAVVDHAEADPTLDPVAEIEAWIEAHDLLAAPRRHAHGAAARAALDRGDRATARAHLDRAATFHASIGATATAMRTDKIYFGATPRSLFAIMLANERHLGLQLPPG
ncbi:hypothetical protein JOD54_005457 [Actinokineospora baliensis]|uniref:hypothetical protein n=1 Tax=Actinokineospora baliensis TaxID=547056 RepID=UPI001957E4CB|nr:hypothetical protein [Actinokineospora baliensis]MBM7775253.1 hypothetical protein [Actinokineospora baliensis]